MAVCNWDRGLRLDFDVRTGNRVLRRVLFRVNLQKWVHHCVYDIWALGLVGSLLSFVVVDKEVGALNSANMSCNRSVVFVYDCIWCGDCRMSWLRAVTLRGRHENQTAEPVHATSSSQESRRARVDDMISLSSSQANSAIQTFVCVRVVR